MASSLIVRVGMYNRYDLNGVQNVSVEAIHFHQSFRGVEEGNDIAVLVLSDDIQFNERSAPACLPISHARTGDRCLVSGWGTLQCMYFCVRVF